MPSEYEKWDYKDEWNSGIVDPHGQVFNKPLSYREVREVAEAEARKRPRALPLYLAAGADRRMSS